MHTFRSRWRLRDSPRRQRLRGRTAAVGAAQPAGHQYPASAGILRSQHGSRTAAAAVRPLRPAQPHAGCRRSRACQPVPGGVCGEMLGDGPLPLTRIAQRYAAPKAVDRLVERGLVIVSGLTPSDAAHILGRQSGWNRRSGADRRGALDQGRSGRGAAGRPQRGTAGSAHCRGSRGAYGPRPDRVCARRRREASSSGPEASLGRRLVDQAVGPAPQRSADRPTSPLARPIVAIGAPVGSYYPEVARRLRTRLVVPPNAGVCNAVGAVAGGVLQTVNALITSPAEGRFRTHLPSGNRIFRRWKRPPISRCAEGRALATRMALEAGAADVEITPQPQGHDPSRPDGLRALHREPDRSDRPSAGRASPRPETLLRQHQRVGRVPGHPHLIADGEGCASCGAHRSAR